MSGYQGIKEFDDYVIKTRGKRLHDVKQFVLTMPVRDPVDPHVDMINNDIEGNPEIAFIGYKIPPHGYHSVIGFETFGKEILYRDPNKDTVSCTITPNDSFVSPKHNAPSSATTNGKCRCLSDADVTEYMFARPVHAWS